VNILSRFRSKSHPHEWVITGNGTIMFGYCCKCGLRSPAEPHVNGAWAKDLVAKAQMEGTAYVDKRLIIS